MKRACSLLAHWCTVVHDVCNSRHVEYPHFCFTCRGTYTRAAATVVATRAVLGRARNRASSAPPWGLVTLYAVSRQKERGNRKIRGFKGLDAISDSRLTAQPPLIEAILTVVRTGYLLGHRVSSPLDLNYDRNVFSVRERNVLWNIRH